MQRGRAPFVRLIALALFSIAPGIATATNLPGFVADAVASSPEVREQIHAYRQVIQDHEVALSGWRPSLDLSASYGAVSRKASNTGQRRREFDSAEASLTLSQNLFDGFDTTNQIKQARARITSSAYLLLDTADNVALEAVRAYMNALTERQLVRYAAENVDAHERILAKIQELSAQGITRRSDVEQTQGRLARAKASLIAQQNNLEDALTTLHKLLGRYVHADELEEPNDLESANEDIERLLDRALNVHPAIESAKRNIEAARFDHERSKSSDLPRLDLQVRQNLGQDVDGPSGSLSEGSVLLNLNYNLFRGGADRAEQRKRASALHANKAFLDRVRRQVIDALRLAWSADRALGRQLPFLAEHVEKSLETLDLYREEYLLQRRDLIDVLDAESELNNALSALAEARYASHTARLRVQEGSGELFSALALEATLSDDEFRLVGLEPRAVDAPKLSSDVDSDGREDVADQCDNSKGPVNEYGCDGLAKLELGYQGVESVFQPQPDEIVVRMDTPTTITMASLLANDRSADRAGLRIRSFGQPEHGTVESDGEGELVYTPAAGFMGRDRFDYDAVDRRGKSASISVSLDVRPPTVAPGYPDPLTIRFDYKKSTLTHDSMAQLEPLLQRLKSEPGVQLQISTYTDNIGSRGYNQRLSQRRAQAVKEMLESRGIDASRITSIGRGESNPIADNTTEAGRALNRRGELRFFRAP